MHEVVLVTGGADRIGKAIVERLANDGYTVAIHFNRSTEKARALKDELIEAGVRCDIFQADLTDYEAVVQLKTDIEQKLGSVSAVINNAGYAQLKSFFDYKPHEWQLEIETDFHAVLHLAHIFVPAMREKQFGKFISLIGDSARTGDRKLIVSAAARGGVMSFIKSLSLEVGRDNVQCNTVSLGLIDQQDLNFSEEVLKNVRKTYAANRLGTVEDITGTIAFLLSKDANWLLGQVISINGGQTNF